MKCLETPTYRPHSSAILPSGEKIKARKKKSEIQGLAAAYDPDLTHSDDPSVDFMVWPRVYGFCEHCKPPALHKSSEKKGEKMFLAGGTVVGQG